MRTRLKFQFNATFNLASLTTSGQWTKIWNKSFEHLKTSSTPMECLQTIRILSRDKTYLNETINEEQFDCLLNIANIGMFNQQMECEVQIEALKILCNLVFQSPKCQESCLKNSAVEGIVKRLRTYKWVLHFLLIFTLFETISWFCYFDIFKWISF